jgi:glucokinase
MTTRRCYLGIDVGGSHISLELVDADTFERLPDSTVREPLDTHTTPTAILSVFERAIRACASRVGAEHVLGVGLAIPGPFIYEEGICCITPHQNKYEQMFGVNFRQYLSHALDSTAKPVVFNNDAACFALGEYFRGGAQGFKRPVVVTLGTGFGASFLKDGRPQTKGADVPAGGELWHVPYRTGIADDFFSTRWLVAEWQRLTGQTAAGGKEIAQAAKAGDAAALQVFQTFGENLAEFVAPWLEKFGADAFVIGGNIALTWDLFIPAFEKGLAQRLPGALAVRPCTLGEQAPIYGAALALTLIDPQTVVPAPWSPERSRADLEAWRTRLQQTKRATIEGPASYPWKSFVAAIDATLRAAGRKAVWFDLRAAAPEGTIDAGLLANIRPDETADLSIAVGAGASQVAWSNAQGFQLS